MKKLLFAVSVIALAFSACKKDPCETATCLNGATCVDNDGVAECQCTSGWEGADCGTSVNEKFAGAYTADPANSTGGVSYSCNVSTGASKFEIVFDNIDENAVDITGQIQEDNVSYELDVHTFSSGTILDGSGSFNEQDNSISLNAYYVSTNNDTVAFDVKFIK